MTKGKRGLGRGLNALIPEKKVKRDNEKDTLFIKISDIKVNKDQPRKKFHEEKLDMLSESIKKHGVIQPIIVKPIGNKYEIIAGERRFRATKKTNLVEIPCIIKNVEDKDQSEIALIENLQRENLNPIEEAMAYKRLMEKHKLTQENIALIIGKSRSYVANTLRLVNLPQFIKEKIIDESISSGHARILLRFLDEELQRELMIKVIENQLSVRQLENLANSILKPKEEKSKKEKKKKDHLIAYIEDNLKSLLGTKVNIINGKKKGKIEIEYYSEDELNRIIEFMQGR